MCIDLFVCLFFFYLILMVVLSTYAIHKQMVEREIMSRKMITISDELPEQLGLLDVEMKENGMERKEQ